MSRISLDHAVILVTSPEASGRFYGALLPLLGFARNAHGEWTNGDGVSFKFEQAHEGTRPYERYGAGLNHIGFSAPDRAALTAIAEAMAAEGFEVPAVQMFGRSRALFLPDPDGLRFEITHELEAT